MPAAPRGLPTIFLGETSKTEREVPEVYLCETGHDGDNSRLKWLASTCLAGMVGVCLIGVAIYASMNMSDGSGMVNSIKRASLAALQPIRGARIAQDAQSISGQKEDLIETTSAGFAKRHVIHDTIVETQGAREFITIKPYVRIVAGLASDTPENADKLPPFNPFKLYSDKTPIGGGKDAVDASQSLLVNVLDVPGGILLPTDDIELEPEQVDRMVMLAAENFAYADSPLARGEQAGEGALTAYRPGEVDRPSFIPNTTILEKLFDKDNADREKAVANAEKQLVTVKRGDTLTGVLMKSGANKALTTEIMDSLDAVFGPEDLKPKQKVDFRLLPSAANPDLKEPVRVSVFDARGKHVVTATRNRDGDYLSSTTARSMTSW